MTNRTLATIGKNCVAAANDDGVKLHRSTTRRLLDAPVAVHVDHKLETLLHVARGTLQVMINGAVGYLRAGEFARIPAGTHYAYRNASDEMVEVTVAAIPRAKRPTGRATTFAVTAAA